MGLRHAKDKDEIPGVSMAGKREVCAEQRVVHEGRGVIAQT